LRVAKFAAAFEDPYAVLASGRFSWQAILPAAEERTMNFGIGAASRSSAVA
jgi:hypothetical protein